MYNIAWHRVLGIGYYGCTYEQIRVTIGDCDCRLACAHPCSDTCSNKVSNPQKAYHVICQKILPHRSSTWPEIEGRSSCSWLVSVIRENFERRLCMDSIGVLLLLFIIKLVEGDVGPRRRPARFLQPLSDHSGRIPVRILRIQCEKLK